MSAPLMVADYMASVLEHGLECARRGRWVFPLEGINTAGQCTCGVRDCSDAGKHPKKDFKWKQAATRDEDQIRKWFGPGASLSNIGLVTGEKSGITVLDIDTANGKRGAETWAALIEESGEPQTLLARTGSGGMHCIFNYNSALKTSKDTLGPGVDCRNDGGYIVAPPSRHRSGGVYSWLNDLPAAPLPAHLTRKIETRGRPRKDDPTHRKYSLEQVREMLTVVPADDRDLWRAVGIILGREFNRSDEAWEAYREWAAKWEGTPGRNHDVNMREAFCEISKRAAEKELSMGTIVKAALAAGWVPKSGQVPIEQFVFYGPGNNFIYRPTGAFWIAEAVNAACTAVNEGGKLTNPATWLRLNMLATSMTSDPALEGDYVKGIDYKEGVRMHGIGAAAFNRYRPPTIESGDAALAGRYIEHVRKLLPRAGDADQFLDYMAHRVQKPGEKPRFALLIAGEQGVGKDTAVGMCCPAIGEWNVASIEPSALDNAFNEYASKVLVRIAEAANQHDMTKWAFNEKTKVLIAGNSDLITINPKYGQQYQMMMHCGVILTTNHLLSGVYIPPDDRRYDVMQGASLEEMGLADSAERRRYFDELWAWFNEGGAAHVAAFLRERDLSSFSPNNGQRKTEAHRDAVASGMESDGWLLDILEELGHPDAVRSDVLCAMALKNGSGSAKEVNARALPALLRAGYAAYPNKARKDRKWPVADDHGTRTRVAVYVKNGTTLADTEGWLKGEAQVF